MNGANNLTYEQIYEKLIEKIKSYNANADLSMVEKAYKLAVSAHGEQLRKSGEPYMVHPVSVAYILAEMELDIDSIVAGILHDVVEDTEYTKEDIQQLFTEDIAAIVDGVTKLQAIDYKSKEEAQAENYRKMFMAMADDVRVIMVKIADRLHNMRTLKYMIKEKQEKIAQETLDIYAPISHKLGISKIKCELEDLCFRYLYPDEYYKLANDIELKQDERNEHINLIINELKGHLDSEGIKYEIAGRPKHFYSIYKKMKNQDKSLDEMYDLFAVRVLVDTNGECYHVLGVVNSVYHSLTARFKDYISRPKENGYQSLHNTLMGPNGEFFEIQIRTYQMHKISEYGVAAHWKYKEGRTKENNEDKAFAWIREIIEYGKDTPDNHEFLGAVKGNFNFYDDRVYCFTPNGDLRDLAKGATVVDFAYYIHSDVGNKMTGAKVNGKIVPLDYVLQHNDRVEIITSKIANGPNPNWLKLAKTPKAKSKINQWFNAINKDENISKGIEIVAQELKKKGYIFKDIVDEDMRKFISTKFKYKSFESLLAGIGPGGIKDGAITNKIIERYEELHSTEDLKKRDEELLEKLKAEQLKQTQKPKHHNNAKGVILAGTGFTEAKFSKCCAPLPGDKIVAFTTRGRGITVHRKDCINIVNISDVDRERLLDASWDQTESSSYIAKLELVLFIENGLLVKLSNLFQTEGLSMSDLNMRTVNDEVIVLVEFSTKNVEELERVINKLSSLSITKSVRRINV